MTALAQGDRQSKTAGQKNERRIPTGWSQSEVKYSVIPVKSCAIHNSVYCFISSPKKIRLQFFFIIGLGGSKLDQVDGHFHK